MLVLQLAYQHEVSPETTNYLLRLARFRELEYHWIHRSPTASARNELMTRAMRARRHTVALWLNARAVPGVDPQEMNSWASKIEYNGRALLAFPYELSLDAQEQLFGFECVLMNLDRYRQRWVFGPWFEHTDGPHCEGQRHFKQARTRQLWSKRVTFSRKATR